ncbi:MAG: ATP-grasp domain-containing protein, partial [Bdellovibrionota bacterium]
MSERWLIAVTAGRWQMNGIAQAREAGLRVLAIDGDPNAEGLKIADRSICHDLSKHDEIIALLKESDITSSIRGAVSFCSEVGMELAARIRSDFDLPGLRPSTVRRYLDKGIQRSLWKEKRVPGPRFEIASDSGQARRAIENFGFPVIVKPIDSSGSRGVTKLESPSDDISAAVERAFEFSRTASVIVESFMEGTEFTVEVFADRGRVQVLAVTEKKKVPGTRGTVARELATPLRSPDVVDNLGATVVKAFEALDYRDGPGHA